MICNETEYKYSVKKYDTFIRLTNNYRLELKRKRLPKKEIERLMQPAIALLDDIRREIEEFNALRHQFTKSPDS